MYKKLILFLFAVLVTISVFAHKCNYLKDPENKDISNNHISVSDASEPFDLKFTSYDSISYYIIWPPGNDTIMITADSMEIFRIRINPNDLKPAQYWVEVLSQNKEKDINFSFEIKERVQFYIVILNVLLGLVFFMIGLRYTSKGLSHISGHRLKEILWNLSDSPAKGTLAGIILTVMLQSSTVFSVMITSFVSDQLIGITGAMAMLAGSAIGTSIVVQIIAFDISFFSLMMIILGFVFYDKIRKMKNIGAVMMGFGLIFLAIKTMSTAIIPIQNTAVFESIILFLQTNPVLLFILTAIFTFSVHSSAVTVALVMGFAATGQIPFTGAVIMIAAANLGTTFTATLASMKGNRKARYVAIVNALMKLLIGALFLVIVLNFGQAYSFLGTDARGIANMHLLFNIIFAISIMMLIPLINKIGEKMHKLEPYVLNTNMINESMSKTPTLALGHIYNKIIKMAQLSYDLFDKSYTVLKTNDTVMLDDLIKSDDEIDRYEKEITLFLVHLSEEELSPDLTAKIKSFLFIVDEIEHIGDIVSKNLMVSARKKIDNNYYFSEEGMQDIKLMYTEVKKTISRTIGLMTLYDADEAEHILRRRKTVLNELNNLHMRHLQRMTNAVKESIETSTLHLDILNDYERVNFHSYKMCYYIKEQQK